MCLLKTGSRMLPLIIMGRQNGIVGVGGRFNLARPLPLVNSPGHLTIAAAASSSYRKLPWVEPTINELPVPEGSWDVAHKKMQTKYGRQLFFGGSFFVFTIFFMFTSGLVQFNATIPQLDAEYLAKGSGTCPPPVPPPKC